MRANGGAAQDTLEQRELLALYRLHEMLEAPMAELYAMKEKLLLDGIVVCPTLEELYAALNSAKARLLGPTSLRIAMPKGRESGATVAKKGKGQHQTRRLERRRSELRETHRLTVNVRPALPHSGHRRQPPSSNPLRAPPASASASRPRIWSRSGTAR